MRRTITAHALARYDQRTTTLHWTSAGLILFMWCGAHAIDWFPKGSARVDARSVHIVVGIALALLIGLRVTWRMGGGVRFARAGVLDRLAGGVHAVLYGLVLGTIALGIGNAWLRADSLFGWVHIPALGAYPPAARHALVEQVTSIHALCANALLMLAAGHGAMALFHHFVRRDGVLRRML